MSKKVKCPACKGTGYYGVYAGYDKKSGEWKYTPDPCALCLGENKVIRLLATAFILKRQNKFLHSADIKQLRVEMGYGEA